MSSNVMHENSNEEEINSDSNNVNASIVFIQSLQHQVNEHDVNALIQSQKNMLSRFEKTNEMLLNCNSLLAARHSLAIKDLKRHINLLVDLRKDLETVFRRIRFLKMKLSQQYHEAFSACVLENVLDEEEDLSSDIG